MPQSLKLNLLLRGGSVAVFLLAIILAAILNRPILMIPLMAGVMTLSSIIALRRSPLTEITHMQPDGTPPPRPTLDLARISTGFILRLGALAALFIAALGLTALFTDTALAREIGAIDLALLIIPLLAALGMAEMSARLTARQVAGAIGAFQGMFAEVRDGPGGEGGEIIEGEIIDEE